MKGNLIKKIRQELEMTQQEFANKAGIRSYQQVSGLESGRRNIGLSLLTRIVNNLSANGVEIALDITITLKDKQL